jgi:hypothetical protein
MQNGVNLGGYFVIIFYSGPKSQICDTQRVKTVIKPLNYSKFQNLSKNTI